MRSSAWLLGVCAISIATGSLVLAQRRAPPLPDVPMEPLTLLERGPCDPPFHGSNCPPPPGDPQCRTPLTAESRDRTVRVEIVEDGHPADLVAIHLVLHDGARSFIRRELGHSGVGCGTFEMYGASYEVDSVRVRDVLFGPRPEVIVIARSSRGRQEILCSTDTSPPACTRGGDITALPRFRRPDVVISGVQRYRLLLPAPTTP